MDPRAQLESEIAALDALIAEVMKNPHESRAYKDRAVTFRNLAELNAVRRELKRELQVLIDIESDCGPFTIHSAGFGD